MIFTRGWRILAVMVGSLCACGSASARQCYVATTGSDTDPGTQEHPWATLQHAVEVVDPGDTIVVAAGTYAGCRIQRPGKPDAPCTLKAEEGAKVVLDRPGPSNRRRSVLEVGSGAGVVSHWVIDGLEVINSPMWGVNLGRTEYVTVQNCRVHDCHQTGIFTSFTDHVTIQFNESWNNGEHGIYHSNSGDYPVIRGNRSHDNAGCGIHMNGDINMGGDGLISFAVVERNVIWGNGTRGGSAINCDGVSDSIIRNNLCYHNQASGISLYAIDGSEGSSRNQVLNNTLVMGPDGRWVINIPWWQRRSRPVGNVVMNNLLYTSNPATGSILIWGPEAVAASDYNVVVGRFSDDGVIGVEVPVPPATRDAEAEGGQRVLSLEEWRQGGYDAHSVVASPEDLFVDAAGNDYQLRKGSPAAGMGKVLPEVTEDLEGHKRGKEVDAGCYALPR